jgi:hypothetical protein
MLPKSVTSAKLQARVLTRYNELRAKAGAPKVDTIPSRQTEAMCDVFAEVVEEIMSEIDHVWMEVER